MIYKAAQAALPLCSVMLFTVSSCVRVTRTPFKIPIGTVLILCPGCCRQTKMNKNAGIKVTCKFIPVGNMWSLKSQYHMSMNQTQFKRKAEREMSSVAFTYFNVVVEMSYVKTLSPTHHLFLYEH